MGRWLWKDAVRQLRQAYSSSYILCISGYNECLRGYRGYSGGYRRLHRNSRGDYVIDCKLFEFRQKNSGFLSVALRICFMKFVCCVLFWNDLGYFLGITLFSYFIHTLCVATLFFASVPHKTQPKTTTQNLPWWLDVNNNKFKQIYYYSSMDDGQANRQQIFSYA